MAKKMRVQEPIAPYVADDDRKEAKLFANGRSQAIRLPKEFRMPGEKVWIHREGNRLIVEPVETISRDAQGHRIGLWDELDGLCGGIPDEDWGEFERVADDDPVPPPLADDPDLADSSDGGQR